MTETTPTPINGPAKAASKTAWKKAAVHAGVTLPSGTVVTIKLPNITQMIRAGNIPNELVDAAIEFQAATKITRKLIEDQWDYVEWIIPETVLDPPIAKEDVADIPAEDLDQLAGFIARTNDIDAVGHHLGGLETSADWRRFRGQLTVEEVAERL